MEFSDLEKGQRLTMKISSPLHCRTKIATGAKTVIQVNVVSGRKTWKISVSLKSDMCGQWIWS